MSAYRNPFVRGYRKLRVVRTLLITWENDCPPLWRPLHPSQAHLPDADVALFPCLFGQDFALITEGQAVPEALEAQCQTEGLVRAVVHAVHGTDFDGTPVHVGDTYSAEDARERVQHLGFETGRYSRCWEISTAHLTAEAFDHLAARASAATPSGLLFEAFRLPHSRAIGVKLIAAPWTGDILLEVEGITADQLREQHRAAGVPAELIEVLHQAGQADVRMLIFDADAAVLDGLPLFEA